MNMIGNLLRVTDSELSEYLQNSSLLEKRIYNESEEEDPNLVDIDKSWEGILFLLTGQNLEKLDHPLGKVLFSGQIIDEEQDLGYGPAQYLISQQVKEVNSELNKITPQDLGKRFDARRMVDLEIYPNVWDEEGILDYLIEYFETIRETYSLAAEKGEAIITFLN